LKAQIYLWVAVAIAIISTSVAARSSEESKPDLVLETGHSEEVRIVAFSKNGEWAATADREHTLKFWDVEQARELRTFVVDDLRVTAMSLSQKGQLLAAGGFTGLIRAWDVETGRAVFELPSGSSSAAVTSIEFSTDSRWLAAGDQNGSIRIFDVSSQKEIRRLQPHGEAVTVLVASPDGRWLATGSAEEIKLWNTRTWQEAHSWVGHTADRETLAFSADSRWLVSPSEDNLINVWNVESGQQRRSFEAFTQPVSAVAFSTDSKSVLAMSEKGLANAWNIETGELQQLVRNPELTKAAVALSPDGRWIARAYSFPSLIVRLFDVHARIWVPALRGGNIDEIRALAVSQNGFWLASGGSRGSIKLWDLRSGTQAATLSSDSVIAGALSFSPDGQLLVSGSFDKTILLWDVPGAKRLRPLGEHRKSVNALAFSPDGTEVLSGSDDESALIWEYKTGAIRHKLSGHSGSVDEVAFTADGRFIVTASHNETKIWQRDTGEEVFTVAARAPIAVSPDSRSFAADRSGALSLFDLSTGKEIRHYEEPQYGLRFSCLTFSPDGQSLVAGTDEGKLVIGQVSDTTLRVLDAHKSKLTAVAFGPGGKWLASSSRDGTIQIRDPHTGELLVTLISTRNSSGWVTVTPDGLFDGSSEGWKFVLWRFGDNTFDSLPVEVFFDSYYYPGLLAEILAGKRPKAPLTIGEKDRRLVKTSIALKPSSQQPVASREVTLTIQATEARSDSRHRNGSGVRDIRLFRNSTLIRRWSGDQQLDNKGTISLDITIPIVAGQNRVAAYAFSHADIKSQDAVLTLQGDSSLSRPKTAHILAIGINKYSNADFNLKYAVADAEIFAQDLGRSLAAEGKFANVERATLSDENATADNIREALKQLTTTSKVADSRTPQVFPRMSPSQPEDAVFVYFAGHGIAHDGHFYLIPHDMGYGGQRTGLGDQGLLTMLRRSISDRELEDMLATVDGTDIILVIDACNSGQALDSEEKRRGPMNSKGLAQLAYEKGMKILTAAQGYQAALEADWLGHGFLTYALIEEALKTPEADTAPKDGAVDVREWLDYATRRVPDLQLHFMLGGPKEGRGFSIVDAETPGLDPAARILQRPRVFYRRELEEHPLIIAKPQPTP
jgi:WD40 repeat protein